MQLIGHGHWRETTGDGVTLKETTGAAAEDNDLVLGAEEN